MNFDRTVDRNTQELNGRPERRQMRRGKSRRRTRQRGGDPADGAPWIRAPRAPAGTGRSATTSLQASGAGAARGV